MTIDEAINELINSEDFKQAARQDAKLRVSLGRINKGNANKTLKIDLLESFGYIVDVKSPNEKVIKKKGGEMKV